MQSYPNLHSLIRPLCVHTSQAHLLGKTSKPCRKEEHHVHLSQPGRLGERTPLSGQSHGLDTDFPVAPGALPCFLRRCHPSGESR